jgi:hypothetical protein
MPRPLPGSGAGDPGPDGPATKARLLARLWRCRSGVLRVPFRFEGGQAKLEGHPNMQSSDAVRVFLAASALRAHRAASSAEPRLANQLNIAVRITLQSLRILPQLGGVGDNEGEGEGPNEQFLSQPESSPPCFRQKCQS